MDFERLFLDNLGVIDHLVRIVARRHRLTTDEGDELGSCVRLKLVENGYAALKKFEGRSSLRTYLTILITRVCLDMRIARWGKWRPSAQARRLGPVAVLLDRLLTRDRLTADEAFERLRTDHGVTLSSTDLDGIRVQLPARVGRRQVSDDVLAHVADDVGSEEGLIGLLDQADVGGRIEQALAAALRVVPDADRLVLKMRFQDNLQVSQISRLLGSDQKALYRRIEQVMQLLRRELESRGVSRDQIRDLVRDPLVDIGSVLTGAAAESERRRPSMR